ncbi:MAG: MFS transporter, partial [Eubacterium sp.]
MTITENTEQVKVTGYSIIIAVLCLLTYSVSFVCRNVWNSALAVPGVTDGLGITALQAGGLATAFYVGYVVSNFFSGFIVDKFGPKISLLLAAAGTGLFTLLIPLASSYAMIFALRVLAGIASGPLFAGCAKMNYGWFDDKRRGVAVGFIMSGPAVGGAIASAAFVPIIQNQSWQTGFIIAGIIAIAVGILMLVFGKEKGLALASSKIKLTAEEKKSDT